MKKMFLAAAGYVVIVFPLAVGWHLGYSKRRIRHSAISRGSRMSSQVWRRLLFRAWSWQ